MKKNLVSVIVVNYNGKKWLKDCFDALKNQNYKNIQVIMVDNNSVDDSINYVQINYPNIEIVKSSDNLGFAGGNNLALDIVKGEYVFLLNNDTIIDKDAIGHLKDKLDSNQKIGSLQAKLVLMNEPDKMDSCGSFWTSTTFLYHVGSYKDQSLDLYNQSFKVFCNKGAAQMIRTELINTLTLFDDDFWAYYEETDFCHRVWLHGSECWYEPKALVYHANGGTSLNFNSELIQFHNYKNKLMSFIKNFETLNLLKIIPTYIIMSILISFIFILQGKFKMAMAIYKSYGWNIKNLNKNLKKRKIIQNMRKVTDKDIFLEVKKEPRWKYYVYLFTGLEKYSD